MEIGVWVCGGRVYSEGGKNNEEINQFGHTLIQRWAISIFFQECKDTAPQVAHTHTRYHYTACIAMSTYTSGADDLIINSEHLWHWIYSWYHRYCYLEHLSRLFFFFFCKNRFCLEEKASQSFCRSWSVQPITRRFNLSVTSFSLLDGITPHNTMLQSVHLLN